MSNLIIYLAFSYFAAVSSSCTLTEIPFSNILWSTTEISYNDCKITAVDYFPPYPDLLIVSLPENLLTKFPDLCNVSETLEILNLGTNALSNIETARLQCLNKLRELDLRSNLLTSCPDMSAVLGSSLTTIVLGVNPLVTEWPPFAVISRTLLTLNLGRTSVGNPTRDQLSLYQSVNDFSITNCGIDLLPDFRVIGKKNQSVEVKLKKNAITRMDPEILAHFDNPLWSLGLTSNLISRIPNMMWASVAAGVALDDNPIVCDCHLRWLKTASTGIDLTTMSCESPMPHSGAFVEDIAYGDLQCSGPTRETSISTFNRAAAPNPLPPIGHVVRVRSRFECATRCVNDDACLIFAYRITPDGPECALTDALDMANAVIGAPSGEWGNNDVSWHLTDT